MKNVITFYAAEINARTRVVYTHICECLPRYRISVRTGIMQILKAREYHSDSVADARMRRN